MEIIDEKEREMKFNELEEGAAFAYDGVFYMKIEEIFMESGYSVNAVAIKWGTVTYFDCDEPIEAVEASVVIRE